MSSNPYELRAGLLGQAEGILTHRYHAENERLRYLCDTHKMDAKTVNWPNPPTSDQIIAEAEKLYAFVQKK
tara:strand:- start:819 stop:1031 length:213 start_codon:yes stop_codon:yes gene_type:complete